MMEYRYDRYGITFGRVESDEIPGISTGVPLRSAPVTRFRKQVVGIDFAHYFKVGEKLSLYASIGYYWNYYLDLALASDNRSYQWVDRGSEKRLAFGLGLQFEFHPEHMNPNSNIMLGIGVHSYRGPVVMIGFVKRFNWP